MPSARAQLGVAAADERGRREQDRSSAGAGEVAPTAVAVAPSTDAPTCCSTRAGAPAGQRRDDERLSRAIDDRIGGRLIGHRAEHRDLRVRCDVAAGGDAPRMRTWLGSAISSAAGCVQRQAADAPAVEVLAGVSPSSALFSTKNGRRSGSCTS